MGYSNDSGLPILEGHGHTIGSVHADDHIRERCHQCINALKCSLLLVDIERSEMLIDDSHAARVHLPRHHQVVQVHPQLHRQREPRVKHPQGIVTHIVTQIHPRVRVAPVHLTSCGRESGHALDRHSKIQFFQFHHVDKGMKLFPFGPHESKKSVTFA